MPVLRPLLKQRGYLALSLTTLRLAVGANLVVFTIVNAVWLRPRPIRDPDRVVMVMADTSSRGSSENFFFADLGLQQQVRDVPAFELVAGQVMTSGMYQSVAPRAVFDAVKHPVETLGVTSEYFGVLGLPIRGRDFTRDDDRTGAAPVAIISHELWKTAFGGRSDIIGAIAPASPMPIQIIGVAPPGFTGARLGEQADLWIPRNLVPFVSWAPRAANGAPVEQNPRILGIARLRPGITPAQAERAIEEHGRSMAHLSVIPIAQIFGAPDHRTLIINEGPILRIVIAAAVLVLLGGCATLMGLVLVHYERRRGEFAVRLALGASAGRLARQLAIELACLVGAGYVCAGIVAAWGLQALPALDLPGGISLGRVDLGFDWRVLLAGLGATAFTMMLAAALPMRRFTAAGIVASLITPSATASAGSLRLRKTMLAAHVCTTVVVLVATSLFVRTIQYGFNQGPGFDTTHTVFLDIDVGNMYDTAAAMGPVGGPRSPADFQARQAEFRAREAAVTSMLVDRYRLISRRVVDALSREPGVESVVVGPAPLGVEQVYRMADSRTLETETRTQELRLASASVGVGYFDALGVRLRAGRALTAADIRERGQPAPIVVTSSLAEALWPGQSALGRSVRFGSGSPPPVPFNLPRGTSGPAIEVVGVVEDFAFGSMRFDSRYATFSATSPDAVTSATLSLVILTRDPESMVEPLRRTIAGLVPTAPRVSVRTGRDLVAADLGRERLGAWFFSGFALVALVLGAAGVFGMVAYLAESRRREFGIRAALGATPSNLMRMVITAGLVPVALGTTLGLLGAVWLAKAVESFLMGVNRWDLVSFGAAGVLMVMCAAAAGFAAAWRLRRVAPSEALRAE